MSNFLTLEEFYEEALKIAILNDPRKKETVEKYLKEVKEEYDKITDDTKKKLFDKESLKNPYADSRILFGDKSKIIKKIFVGIDMCSAELLLADRLNERGENIDLVLTHHPNGFAYANFYQVMSMQVDLYSDFGIAVNQSEAVNKKRISEVERSVSPSNHMRDLDTAKLLKMPYACMHTFSDNCVETYLTDLINKENPYRVSDIFDILNSIEEYSVARRNNNPPKMYSGREKNRAGKVVVDMTGGTTPDSKVISLMANAGVGTIVVMHLPEKHREECEKNNINVLCAGHIASDSLGLNLLLKSIKENTQASFDILQGSGYIYIER